MIKRDDTCHHHRGHMLDMLFMDQKLFLPKVLWSSWWRCLSTSFVKGYPQFKFQFYVTSGSWKNERNFFTPVWNLLNKLWVVVHSTSWKFGMYFVYFFIGNWNFLPKFFTYDLSKCQNKYFDILYLKSEISAHAQWRNYSLLHTIWKFHDMVSVGNLHGR